MTEQTTIEFKVTPGKLRYLARHPEIALQLADEIDKMFPPVKKEAVA